MKIGVINEWRVKEKLASSGEVCPLNTRNFNDACSNCIPLKAPARGFSSLKAFLPLDYASSNISYDIGFGESTKAPDTAEANFFTSAPAKNKSRSAFDDHRSKFTVRAGFSVERKTLYSMQDDCSRADFATSQKA